MLGMNQPTEFSINLKQFKKKWKTDSDNIRYFETIIATKGKFFCLSQSDVYENLLNEFNIFYTKTVCYN